MINSTNRNTDFKSDSHYNQGEHFVAHLFFDNLIWLTTDEAAQFLRKSSHALRQMTYKGKVRPRKFGGRLYFKKAELDQLLDTSFF